MTWARRAAAFMGSSGRSIPSMCVARPTWPRTKAPKPQRNSRKLSITAGSWSAILLARWRTYNWAERSLCREIRPRQGLPTRISSLSGKTPTPISRSLSKPRRNTPGCNKRRNLLAPFDLSELADRYPRSMRPPACACAPICGNCWPECRWTAAAHGAAPQSERICLCFHPGKRTGRLRARLGRIAKSMQLLPSRSLLLGLRQLLALLAQHGLAAELDLVAFERQNLDQNLVAFLQLVAHFAHAVLGDLADVQQAVGAGEDLDESAEIHQPHDLAQVGLAHFGHRGDVADDLERLVGRGFVGGRNMHGAVIVHVDLHAGLLDDAANHLAPWSDDVADLIGRNVDGVDARRVFRHVGARLLDGLLHLADDKEAAAVGL